MSRIGRAPIKVPAGVEIKVENSLITVKGPLGQLTQDYDAKVIDITVENGEAVVTRKNEENATKSKHGLYRALLNNMVVGVTAGYTKTLIVNDIFTALSNLPTYTVYNKSFSVTCCYAYYHIVE